MSNITPACPKCNRVLKVQSVLAGFYCGYCGNTFKCDGPTRLVGHEERRPRLMLGPFELKAKAAKRREAG